MRTSPRLRRIAVLLAAVILIGAPAAHAQSIRESAAKVQFTEKAQGATPPAKKNRTANKVAAGVAGALGGWFGGAAIGAFLDRNCGCDDPGLAGAMIGAPIGA